MPKKVKFAGIQKALDDGLQVRAFRSGGGLRVVRIEKHNAPESNRNLKAYGEHPNFREACMLASLDYLAGGNTAETHYLTGSSQPEDNLDAWLLVGHKLVAKKQNEKIRFEAKDYNYKKVHASVKSPTFEQAYTDLSTKLTKDIFDRANRI